MLLHNLINRPSPTSALGKLQIGVMESAAVYHRKGAQKGVSYSWILVPKKYRAE